MKNWFIKNKSYILIFIVILAVLTVAFFSDGIKKPVAEPAQIQVSDNVRKTSDIQEKTTTIDFSKPEQSASNDTVREISVSSVSETKSQPDVSSTEKISKTSISHSVTESSVKTQISSEVLQPSHMTENAISEVTVISQEADNVSLSEPLAQSSEQISTISVEEQSDISELSADIHYCTLTISCETALKNEKLNDKIRKILPQDGVILAETKLTFEEGESAFDLLKRVCRENGIHLEYSQIPLTGGAYIEGIANLYEFDCGSISGWMYSINDKFPAVGCSDSKLSDGDKVAFLYTCDLGEDIGNHYSGE